MRAQKQGKVMISAFLSGGLERNVAATHRSQKNIENVGVERHQALKVRVIIHAFQRTWQKQRKNGKLCERAACMHENV